MALTVDDIATLARLVTTERLDSLEYDGCRIAKTLHAPLKAETPRPEGDDDDEDLLFHSSGG